MNLDLNQCFIVFDVCIPVKGYKRSLICDTQNNDYFYIPNELYTILTVHNKKTISQIIEVFGSENAEIIIEYFEFLIDKRLIKLYDCNASFINFFSNSSREWQSPKQISNSIIEWNVTHESVFDKVLNDLVNLGCESLEMRFYEHYDLNYIISILNVIEKSSLLSLYLFLKYDDSIDEKDYTNLLNDYTKIIQIVVHGYDKKSKKLAGRDSFSNVIIQKSWIKDCSSCGIVNQNYFRSNISFFNESLHYNSCLNKKISIDLDGNIKNCPSLKETYGNIHSNDMFSVLSYGKIKDLWGITKNHIEVCKECEHRYICSDCRAYIQDDNNVLSKPLKCNYDPYTATWTDNTH